MRHSPSLLADPFRTQICRRLNGKLIPEIATRPPRDQEFVMSIEHLPRDNEVRRDQFRDAGHAIGVRPLNDNSRMQSIESPESPQRDDKLLAALSPLLDEVDGLRGDEAREQESNNVMLLLEENARLRKLAVKLSNLLGDLPAQGR
jgi:hypothetical protein